MGGGDLNKAGGAYSAVPGGVSNSASGTGSFAAGVKSTAGYSGDFVWSDDASGATALSATVADQFLGARERLGYFEFRHRRWQAA